MVLSIVSALFALPLIIFAGIGFGDSLRRGRSRNFLSMIFYGIQLLIGLLQGVVAITTAAFSCRAVCCGRKSHPGAVIFTSGNTAGDQTFTTIPLNANCSTRPATRCCCNFSEHRRRLVAP